jgi:hypothetical protein
MIDSSYTLDVANAILQIDATTLAGVLILLTIRSFVSTKDPAKARYAIRPSWVVGLVGTPFAFSAMMVLFSMIGVFSPVPPSGINYAQQDMGSSVSVAGMFTIVGFLYMIVVFFKINMPVKKPKEVKEDPLTKIINKFLKQRTRRKRIKGIRKRYEKIFKTQSSRFSRFSQIFTKNNSDSFRD